MHRHIVLYRIAGKELAFLRLNEQLACGVELDADRQPPMYDEPF